MENKEDKKTVDVFEGNQTRFEALTTEDAKKWFETHDLIERDVQDICRFLNNYQNDKDTLLEILRFIIIKVGGGVIVRSVRILFYKLLSGWNWMMK